MTKDEFKVRVADMRDARSFWQLRNELSSRSNSLTGDEIDWDSHIDWFQRRLDDPQTRVYILEHGGSAAATVRFQPNAAGRTMTHIVVAPQFRGRGVAQHALQSTVPLALRDLQLTSVHAVIKKSNLASMQAFIKSGYVVDAEADCDDLVTLTHTAK